MNGKSIQLKHTPGLKSISLAELNGQAELSVDSTRTETAIGLVSSLSNIPDSASLVIADRDRVLSSIYTSTYGSQLQSTIVCTGCRKPFDIDFELDRLEQHLWRSAENHSRENSAPEQGAAEYTVADEHGFYHYPGHGRFRLPTGQDELAVAGKDPQQAVAELCHRCITDVRDDQSLQFLQHQMEQIAPLIDTEMDVTCPECGLPQYLRFDIQSFLLQKILGEKSSLLREIHELAKSYHWTLPQILDLPRSVRKRLVTIIENER